MAVSGERFFMPVIRARRMCAAFIAVFCAAGAFQAAADGTKTLPMHRAPRAPTTRNLPPPSLVGDPATRLTRPYSGRKIDVTNYHYDTYPTGWNPAETDLTPATVASARFGLLETLRVDGNVFAQPLLVSRFLMPDGSRHDVLVIATGHNSVYAFDAETYATLWKVGLGPAQTTSDVGCGDVVPEYGISSTPIIVRTGPGTATLYVVAASAPAPSHLVTRLHALDLATGADTIPPTVVAPKARLAGGALVEFNPFNQWNRASLAFRHGAIYIGIGSHCDENNTSITGWLLQYGTDLKLRHAFHTVNTPGGTELASIWMTGFAPAIDPDGNVFVVTGNGDFTRGQKDWGESVLKLPPDLSRVTSSFTDANYQNLNNGDGDLGSGGVMLLPAVPGQTAPPLAVALGKASTMYLLDQNRLGGLRANNEGALQAQAAGGEGLWGGPAYYNGPAGPTVFTQTTFDVLRAWSVATGAKPSLTNTISGSSIAGYGGSLPIVSSNGATAQTGIVWLIDRANEPFTIEAYDAVQLGAPLFTATIGKWSNAPQGNPFLTLMEANGRVYAPGYKLVRVFGLAP